MVYYCSALCYAAVLLCLLFSFSFFATLILLFFCFHCVCVGPDFWRFHIHIRSTHTVIGARADITKERTKIEHKNTSISTRQELIVTPGGDVGFQAVEDGGIFTTRYISTNIVNS